MSQADIRKFEQQKESTSNLYTPRGNPTAFKSGSEGYQVKSHSYPDDLLADDGRYGGHYVVFYINVQVDSKLSKSLKESDFVKELTPRDRGDLVGQNLSREKLFAGNAAIIGGSAILGSALGVGSLSIPAAALATVGAGATANYAASASRAQRRLKTAIALHVPNQLQIRYGTQWSEEDTAGLAMATSGIEEILKAVGAAKGGAELGDIGKGLGASAQAMVTNLALSKGPMAGANSVATGLAANPKKEQAFKGVDFRTFQFEYQFFPRSAAEAENVMRIIYEFKYHMHPEFKDANNFVYIYPSEFDIFYYQNGVENKHIHRHTSCVLTEMSVNYTPNGTFATFENGMPTQINVQMSFRELALLTKDKVKDGL
jgi:hypothetical protein